MLLPELTSELPQTAYIEIGRMAEFNPPFPLTRGMSFVAKLVVCLKLPSLSLFLEKATHSFQPQAFRVRMTAFGPLAVVHSTFPAKT